MSASSDVNRLLSIDLWLNCSGSLVEHPNLVVVTVVSGSDDKFVTHPGEKSLSSELGDDSEWLLLLQLEDVFDVPSLASSVGSSAGDDGSILSWSAASNIDADVSHILDMSIFLEGELLPPLSVWCFRSEMSILSTVLDAYCIAWVFS